MIKSLWLRLGGPNSVSFLVWLVLSPIGVLGSFFALIRDVPRGQEPLLFLAAIVSYLPSGVVLGLAWLTYLSPKTSRASRPKLAVTTFFLAGYSTGMTFAVLLDVWGLQEQPNYLAISGTRALIGLYWSSLLALVMDSHRQFAAQVHTLTKSIQAAEEIAKSRVAAVDALRVDLISKVKNTIDVALNVRNRADLNVAADQIVRPLVDALRSKGVTIPEPNSSKLRKISVRPVLLEALTRPQLPILVGLLSSLANLVASVRWLAPVTLLNLVVLGSAIAATLGLIQRLKKTSGFIIFLLYGFGVAVTLAAGEYLQLLAPESARSFANLNLGSWVIAVLLVGFIKFEAKQDEVLARLRATLDEIHWNKVRLEQEMWVERLRLTRYVHGNIQSKIRAAASRSGDLTSQQLEKLKDECLSMLDVEVSPVSFGEFVDQTKRVWLGILEFELELEPGLEKVLEEDSFARVAVIETVREGVLNAVRHGHAKNARLKLALHTTPQGQTLKLRLENDGDPISPDSDSGFGATVLNDSTASWQLENFPGGVVLKAEVPVSPGEVSGSVQLQLAHDR